MSPRRLVPRDGTTTASSGSSSKAKGTVRGKKDLARPELLDDQPRHNLTKVGVRVAVCVTIIVVLTILGLLGHPMTLVPGVVGLVVAGIYGLMTWGDARASLRTDGDLLTARSVLRTRTVRGSDVSRVQYLFNGRYPDFRLVTTQGEKVPVATSRLDKGHTTLFAWLVVHAPHAVWDARSLKFLKSMDEEGWL